MKHAILILMYLVLETYAQNCNYSSVCSNHTMCIYQDYGTKCGKLISVGVSDSADQQTVVDAHNNLRRQVAQGNEKRGIAGAQPSAANMRKITWNDELATVAQRWANQCSFGHDSCRNVRGSYVGQNVFQSSSKGVVPDGKPNWNAAVQAWYNEVAKFDKNNIKPFKFTSGTGHYTQAVWARTNKVGCGFISFISPDGWYKKYYVCNYEPGGNIIGGSMYTEGDACTQCPADASSCDNGLCV